MSSHATVGQEIAHLKAIDADSGLNGEIEYTIIKGNEHDFFALDSASGTLYLAKQLLNNPKPPIADHNETTQINMPTQNGSSPQSFILALKASDKGTTPRSNTTILKIDVIQNHRGDRSNSLNNPNKGTGRHTGNPIAGGGFGMIGDRDLIIITAMIVIALIISFVLIAAIVLLRCRQPRASRNNNGMHGRNSSGGERGRLVRRFEVLNCLGRAEGTFDGKNVQSNAFIITDTERNPNFEEHIHSPPYDSNNSKSIEFYGSIITLLMR
ncbi:unnamed protein product [Rodentolepis nana]|uniref:Cadherin domain-containing protein n=1 Tax=Rodentolepis nana TaxID=102285 RepID=A0A0R3T1I6_RODNA|nr:unnamed protein product [Rodentolepis nana]